MRAPCAPPGIGRATCLSSRSGRPRRAGRGPWTPLMSDPERSAALERAQATRSTVFTPAIDFLLAGRQTRR